MPSPKELIVEQATVARTAFEVGSISRPLLRSLYVAYNPFIEIENFLDSAEELFPNLNCGLASVYMQHILQEGEVTKGTYDGIGHTFLMLGNVAVDITADQFGGPAIYVGELQLPWSVSNTSV